MSKLWADQGRARLRETRHKERERRSKIRKRKAQAIAHPIKTAKKRWSLW